MSAIKGSPNQKRISHQGISENFVSVVATDPKNRAGLDVLPKALYPVSALPLTAEPLDINPNTPHPDLRIVKLTGHSVRKADILRFYTGANKGLEVPVEKVEEDYIFLAGELLEDPAGYDFFHMRHITLTIDELGALSVSPGALQFIKDSVTQQVIKDSANAANTVGLPVEIVGANGTEINLTAGDINVQTSHTGANPDSMQIGDGSNLLSVNDSNEALVHDQEVLDAVEALGAKLGDIGQQASADSAPVVLSTEQENLISDLKNLLTLIDGKDFSTETTLLALEGKDFATEDTQALIQAAVDKLALALNLANQLEVRVADLNGGATEAKQDLILAALNGQAITKKVIDSHYGASVSITNATRVATGVSVPPGARGLELEVLMKVGNNFTAYDAASGGNVIGRFTMAGGRLPCDLPENTQIYLQSDTGSDFTAEDLTINLIGA